jgi:hypothetical protein
LRHNCLPDFFQGSARRLVWRQIFYKTRAQ